MYNFEDLKFKIVCNYEQYQDDDGFSNSLKGLRNHRQAKMFFDNGFGISVVTGGMTYTDSDDEYEIAVLHRKEDGSNGIAYGTLITDDVIGHLSADEVSSYMEKIEQMDAKEKFSFNNNGD